MKRVVPRLLLALGVLTAVLGAGLYSTFSSSPIDAAAYASRTRVAREATGTAQVWLLPTGSVTSKEGFMYRGGELGKDVSMQITAILIEHERGRYLFDAGLSANGDEHFGGTPLLARATATLTLTDSVKTQLEQTGPAPTLDGILLSHAHWDHVSGVEDFADTLPVYVHPDEVEYARTHHMAELARDIGHELEPLAFDDGPYEMWETSEDIFGDGSVVLVHLPGHTPGSMGLFVTTPKKRFFFVGDLVWHAKGVELLEERPWLARETADADPESVREHIVRTHRLTELDPELVVVPAHDAGASALVPSWPGG